jgi:hypothetical protein
MIITATLNKAVVVGEQIKMLDHLKQIDTTAT